MTEVIQDIRYALRQLGKNRSFAVVAVFTLALGIGASAIIFSIVYNGVLYPFPYRSADRLTEIAIEDVQGSGKASHTMFHMDEVAAFRQNNHSFEDILGYAQERVRYARRNGAEMLQGVIAAPNAMEFWGLPPLLGRGMTAHDAESGSPPVVLINYRFWLREFHGDASALGTTMMLNGTAHTLIGVMPPRFQAVGADVYMPVSYNRAEPVVEKFGNSDEPIYFWATGILKRGVSLETAKSDIGAIARHFVDIHPDEYPKNYRVSMKMLNDVVVGNFKKVLLLLFAAVALLLLISCSNVAGLLLAQASARTKEIALRSALGASRGRLVRQLLAESLVLAAAGCVVGCLLAYFGLKGLVSLESMDLPMEAAISLNFPVLLFAVGISLVATLLCGVAPALHARREDLQKGLASTGTNVNATFQHSRFRSGLVIGQVALSLLLLVCAGLVTRSFSAMAYGNPGFRTDNILFGWVHFPQHRYTTVEEKRTYFERALSQINAIPGVASSSATLGLPMLGGWDSDVTIPGRPHPQPWTTLFEGCSETYFQVFGVQLIHGRLLTSGDIAAGRRVAVVNQTLAKKYFSGEDPLGRQLKFNALDEDPQTPHDAYFEIIGVVNDFKNIGLHEAVAPEAFVPYTFSGLGDRALVVRSAVPPLTLLPSIRKVLWDIDQEVALDTPTNLPPTFDDVFRKGLSGPRFNAITFGSCAVVGFVLAIVGLFSVMSYIVSLKKHDIGIRLALGAPRSAILRLMLQKGFVLIGVGVLIGVAASFGLTRLLASQLTGISTTDPLTFALAIATVAGAGLSACLLPARRATQVDPMRTLRSE